MQQISMLFRTIILAVIVFLAFILCLYLMEQRNQPYTEITNQTIESKVEQSVAQIPPNDKKYYFVINGNYIPVEKEQWYSFKIGDPVEVTATKSKGVFTYTVARP